MRIFIWLAAPDWPAGGPIATVALANAMARRGHEVHLALSEFRPDQPTIESEEDLSWLNVHRDVTLWLGGGAPESADICVGLPIRGALPVVFVRGRVRDDQATHVVGHPWPIIAVSEWVAEQVRAHGVAAHRVVRVPDGLDHGVFRALETVDRRAKRVTMLVHATPA